MKYNNAISKQSVQLKLRFLEKDALPCLADIWSFLMGMVYVKLSRLSHKFSQWLFSVFPTLNHIGGLFTKPIWKALKTIYPVFFLHKQEREGSGLFLKQQALALWLMRQPRFFAQLNHNTGFLQD